MKRIVLLTFLAALSATVAAEPAAISGLRDLSRAVADGALGTDFCVSGVVTRCIARPGGIFILQDDACALPLFNHTPDVAEKLAFGDVIIARGRINKGVNSKRPAPDVNQIAILARGRPPKPQDVTPAQLSDPALTRRLVRISGVVQDAFRDELDRDWFFLVLSCENSIVYVSSQERVADERFESLIGEEVSVTGLCMGRLGSNRRMIARSIEPLSFDDVRVLRPRDRTARQTPDVEGFPFLDEPRTAKSIACSARGRVLAVWENGNVLLRTASGSLVKGEIAQPPFPTCGTALELTGHPETDLYDPILVRATWRSVPDAAPVPPEDAPQDVTVALLHAKDPTFRHYDFSFHGRTVRLRGIVRSIPIPGGDGRISLECDSRIVTVDISALPEAAQGLETGYGVEVTGVCVMLAEKMGLNRTIPHIRGLIVVPRTAADLRVVSRPSWWTPIRLLAAIGLLLVVLAAITIWNLALRRLAERRARQLADEELSHVQAELKVSERTRLAVELHDTLSQNITGACLKVNAAEQLLDSAPAVAAEHLSVAAKTLMSCRNEIRNCLWDLRSQALEEDTMDAAIRKTLEPHLDGSADISVRFAVPRTLFTDNTAHVLLCIVRELVLNAVRHGRATAVKVAGCAEDGKILFSVQDNGCGFDPDTAPGVRDGHFGLQGIRERMKVLDGTVEVTSGRDVGTKVRIDMPLPTEKGEKV